MDLFIMWLCNDCNFKFGNPMINSKANNSSCPYCGSGRIEKFE
jgi:predicted Zn-ribbon and HTH transcriptional regulator